MCSLSSLSYSNGIYLHGSTSIGGHFAAIESAYLQNSYDFVLHSSQEL